MKKAKGVISAGDQLTAEAGAEILMAGGNAFDACIAATFMSFAASSSITSAGGGGFLLSYPAAGKPFVYDFFVQTPLTKRPEREIDFRSVYVDFGDKKQEFHVGIGSVATPGNIAGLFAVHRELGSMPMTEIMAPILDRMKKGIKLHAQTKYQIDILQPILWATTEGRKIYQKEGKPLSVGETYYLNGMADFFDYLARTGHREFYEGEIASKIANLSQNGGHLILEDLKNYKVFKREPLHFLYKNRSVLTNPPPNSGGTLIAFLLSVINNVNLSRGEFGSAKHLQTLVEAIRYADLARNESVIIPGNVNSFDALFDQEYLHTVRQAIKQALHKSGNTTHVSVADAKGNVASCTTSVGEGCGYFIPGTEIMLNNMLGEEDLNKQGFHLWKTDARMSSMMSPTLILGKDGAFIGMGSGGSNRIRSAIAQAVINYVDFALPPDEVVNAPRIHLERNHLDIEPGFSEETLDRIALPPGVEKFFWNSKNMYFGGVHAVFGDSKGNLEAAGDRRRAGCAIKVC